ncbi:hypothetical protein [Myxococcus xanthus]|uniref:hypothetical protein n=1 Tax=Myxococcus xanthus TaxID=34 RepID=UPI00031D7159|nr:hypothetical protein [Myxococcus xanthus]QVW70456.1 hypothetical protein JTM82_13245 [Myxococcus xanthus DZ2]QZZ49325.1 hypothetical protein MyxoNM_08950 [Myxococcus xanthus]UEO03416.1 hypothetical protein K1515_29570 [Myxococcus xanthus DZ2]UYI16411.1 hypothetical protein N3T43_08870 [Myxococcus xanthus]UYI23773.1 hypothetical protein N1129_08870 [Myxococcus xanthus]
MRWLHGTADLNRQGNGTATVRVAAPGLYRVRRVASARRARDAYVEVAEEDGALHTTVLGVDKVVPRTTGPTFQVLEERFGITSAGAARAAPGASKRDDREARAGIEPLKLHAAGLGGIGFFERVELPSRLPLCQERCRLSVRASLTRIDALPNEAWTHP